MSVYKVGARQEGIGFLTLENEHEITEEDVETLTELGFNLALSRQKIGELYPVIQDAHGNIIDGFHRLEETPEWRTETLEWVKTDAQLWLARITANGLRRNVPIAERETQFSALAQCLIEKENVPVEKVIKTIASLTTYTEAYVRLLLPPEYKREYTKPVKTKLDPALEIIKDAEPEPEAGPDRRKMTVEEIFSKFNPNLHDDDFLVYMLEADADLTPDQAMKAIAEHRRGNRGVGAAFRRITGKAPFPLNDSKNSKVYIPEKQNATVRVYKELTKWYPVSLIDYLSKIMPAKTLVVWQRNLRRFIRKLFELAPQELRQTVLDEFKNRR